MWRTCEHSNPAMTNGTEATARRIIESPVGSHSSAGLTLKHLRRTTPERRHQLRSADQKDKSGYGKFVSFKDGTLKLKGNYSPLVWHNIPEKIEVVRWDDAAGKYVPSGTAEVLGKVEAGTWIIVGDKVAHPRGCAKGPHHGHLRVLQGRATADAGERPRPVLHQEIRQPASHEQVCR